MKYIKSLLTATSQFFNVLLSPILNRFTRLENFGNADETISGVMGKNIRRNECKFCSVICWFLNKLEVEHCKKSIEDDENA